MKIRTITLGLPGKPDSTGLKRAGEQLGRAVLHFESAGYTVQTRRVALEHWDGGVGKLATREREKLLLLVDALCADYQIDFCSVGIARDPGQIADLVRVLSKTKRLSAGADLASVERGIHQESIQAA